MSFSALGFLRCLPSLIKVKDELTGEERFSKQVMFNLIVALLMVASKVFGYEVPLSGDGVEALAKALSDLISAGSSIILVIGNVWLRYKTTQPMAIKTGTKSGCDNR